ncbi:uncharacterized protein [Parasteatoda tepidariorum]|uniref:uncharacterized protein n=1 Tax=Parasteatoda tepidariorum TaxID=114398 RepID=UPI0039BCE18A
MSSSFLDFEEQAREQQGDEELQNIQKYDKSSLNLKSMPFRASATELISDVSTGSPKPFVPENFRRTFCEQFHNLAHPGAATSFSLIASRYVWPNIKRHVKEWVKSSSACQRSKIHSHTKAPLAHENVKCTETIPVILLGLRAAVKPDIKVSSAELVDGMPLRLPAEICSDTPSVPCDYPFVQQLQEKISSMRPTPTFAHGQQKIFVHPQLKDCTHVFLRVDKIVPPLTQPYTGPH